MTTYASSILKTKLRTNGFKSVGRVLTAKREDITISLNIVQEIVDGINCIDSSDLKVKKYKTFIDIV